jgi:hypothetical protein
MKASALGSPGLMPSRESVPTTRMFIPDPAWGDSTDATGTRGICENFTQPNANPPATSSSGTSTTSTRIVRPTRRRRRGGFWRGGGVAAAGRAAARGGWTGGGA